MTQHRSCWNMAPSPPVVCCWRRGKNFARKDFLDSVAMLGHSHIHGFPYRTGNFLRLTSKNGHCMSSTWTNWPVGGHYRGFSSWLLTTRILDFCQVLCNSCASKGIEIKWHLLNTWRNSQMEHIHCPQWLCFIPSHWKKQWYNIYCWCKKKILQHLGQQKRGIFASRKVKYQPFSSSNMILGKIAGSPESIAPPICSEHHEGFFVLLVGGDPLSTFTSHSGRKGVAS